MIEFYPNPIYHPEGYFYELLILLEGGKIDDNVKKAIVANEICKGQIQLFNLKYQNVAIFTDLNYSKDVCFHIFCRLEQPWGQLRIIRNNENVCLFTFDIVRNFQPIADFNTGFVLMKHEDRRIWMQKANAPLKHIAIFVSLEYLQNIWFWSEEKSSFNNQLLMLNSEERYIEISDYKCKNIVDKAFIELLDNSNDKLFENSIEDVVDSILGTYVFFKDHSIKDDAWSLKKAEIELLKNFQNAPSLIELSKIAGMNRLKFQKLFVENYGCTYYQYYQKKRFDYAKKLIEFMGYTVSEAAYMIGYKHLSHFSQAFAKIHGVKPSEIKNKINNKNE